MNGIEIQIGMQVLVPDPIEGDIHQCEFVGCVESFRNEYVVVVDGEGEYFEIEPERLEVFKEIKLTAQQVAAFHAIGINGTKKN